MKDIIYLCVFARSSVSDVDIKAEDSSALLTEMATVDAVVSLPDTTVMSTGSTRV